MYQNVINILIDGINNSWKKIKDLAILSEKERNTLLCSFNNTKKDYPKDRTIHHFFEEQVVRHPDAISLVFEDQSMTYQELNKKANRLAQLLIKEIKVEVEQ